MNAKNRTLQELDMNEKSYFKYKSFGMNEYIDKLLLRIRSQCYDLFYNSFKISNESQILDIGVSLDSHPASNFLEKHYPWKNNITAVSIDDCKIIEKQFPGLKFVQADGKEMPFENESFDFSHSHAVIEHVGNDEEQIRFLNELWRVSKYGVFLTTPNRAHPIETHTGLPCVHYLPNGFYQKVFGFLGFDTYRSIDQLNLLSVKKLTNLCEQSNIGNNYQIKYVNWLGLPSNILLIVQK